MKKSFLNFIVVTVFIFLGACSDDNHGNDGDNGPEILGLMDGNGGMVDEVKAGDNVTVVTSDDCKAEDGCEVLVNGSAADLSEEIDLNMDDVKDVKAGKKKDGDTEGAAGRMLMGAAEDSNEGIDDPLGNEPVCDPQDCEDWCHDLCSAAEGNDPKYDACVDSCSTRVCDVINEYSPDSVADVDHCNFGKIAEKIARAQENARKDYDKKHVTAPKIAMPLRGITCDSTTNKGVISLVLKDKSGRESKPYEVSYVCNSRRVMSVPVFKFKICETDEDCPQGQTCTGDVKKVCRVSENELNARDIMNVMNRWFNRQQ